MVGFADKLDLKPNRLTELRELAESRGERLIDISGGNPTEQSILFPSDILIDCFSEYFLDRNYKPDPQGALIAREAIAQYYARKKCSDLTDPNHIFVTASTSEAYSLLFSLLCDQGDNILVPTPSYPLFDLLAENSRIELKHYQLVEEAAGWSIDSESLKENTDARTRAILVVSPHNPTGHVITESYSQICDLGLPLISDEVFSEFSLKPHSILAPTCSFYPDLPVFTLNGISKMYALPDLKLGWIGLNKCAFKKFYERLALLNDVFLSANYATQNALPHIMNHGAAVTQNILNRALENAANMKVLLQKIPKLRIIFPQGGLFTIIELPGDTDEELTCMHLLNEGFIVHPGYFYDLPFASSLVISLMSKQPYLTSFMKVLAADTSIS